MARNDPQIPIRLPRDAKDWIKAEATRNGSSQNSEVIRAVRERMAREASNREASA
ncbi:Arc family DNA-binding protein [Nitrobacter sp. JJSN]|uniref:Arc family DNA-binding protein n=1 Tax=Nitrobacter sp. JJSN TaxID=3453033 RepID=UPI003F7777C9